VRGFPAGGVPSRGSWWRLALALIVFMLWAHPSLVGLPCAALLIVADLGTYFWHGFPGYDELGFIAVLACAGFAMFRVWREHHTYT